MSVVTGAEITADVDVACDVCVVGSGAGGAMLAAGLAQAGLRVVIVEAGGYRTSQDFDGQEATAYPMLYQDRGTRATTDLAVTILQGRTVGGGTTINWTTCFRTPDRILGIWGSRFGIPNVEPDALRPHFEAVEARLGIAPWQEELVNANNHVLLDGCRKLGWETEILHRNVRGCMNSGYCGMGCPFDAKQSALVTTVPDALAAGATLYANVHVERFEVEGDRVVAVHGVVQEDRRNRPTGRKVVIRPKVAVSSGGAINSPALLLRSGIQDPAVGKRAMLHPVVAIGGLYGHRVDGWYGAPQSVASHQFVDRGPDQVGYFLECAPVQPVLAASAVPFFGEVQRDFLKQLNRVAVVIAVHVDGLAPGDVGGTVTVDADGRPRVHYPIVPALAEGFRHAHDALGKVHFAAGAEALTTFHLPPVIVKSEAELPALAAAPYGALKHAVFSAHQLGGCVMGTDPATSVVDPELRHHRIKNLFVVDGSVFPTGLGVNPSETIYAFAHRAREVVGRAV